jgi:hypothetical protein
VDAIYHPLDLFDDFGTTIEIMSLAVSNLTQDQDLENPLIC